MDNAVSSSLYIGDTKIALVSIKVSTNMYYTSENTPSNDFGEDGDLYFVKSQE